MSRPGVHNLILLLLVLVVVAVTSLNHYTTKQTLDQFNDATEVAVREHGRSIAVSNAQFLALKAFEVATHEARRSLQFEMERDQARKIALQHIKLCEQFAATIQVMGGYICELEELLKRNNITVPESPIRYPDNPSPKKKTQENLQASLYKLGARS